MRDYVVEWVSLYFKYHNIRKDPEKWFFSKEGGVEKILDVKEFIFKRFPKEKQTGIAKRYILRRLAGDPRWNKI